ncbi:MAG: nicotinate-nucleotide pyrophosphorylase [Deltaproteobacteria bacterium]|nr:nicotinate-nucleotide pyrophosphorylase [Deltaproteobacteria bacterium]
MNSFRNTAQVSFPLPPAGSPWPSPDIRESLFASLAGRTFTLEVTACQAGLFSGTSRLREKAESLGLELDRLAPEGAPIGKGAQVCRAHASAWQAANAEELFLGCIGKASGVATAAAAFVAMAVGEARVVCGAWKKVAPEGRPDLRHAIRTGGAGTRITDQPFVYLDKNYVRMLGGVAPAVRRARLIPGRVVVVQIRGEAAPITTEARDASREGAGILMVDTGRIEDLVAVRDIAGREEFRTRIPVAFGGGVNFGNFRDVLDAGADIVDVGRAIIDAPLLDFRLDVVG